MLALHRGLRSVQEMYAGGQVISMPLSETMIAGWLSDAYSDARLAAVSLEGLLGGTSFQVRELLTLALQRSPCLLLRLSSALNLQLPFTNAILIFTIVVGRPYDLLE